MQNLEQFKQITAGNQAWNTINDLLELCDTAADFWEAAWLKTATAAAKKAVIRRFVRQLKDEDGWPAIASIVVTETDGTQQRIYKQEELFHVEDYRQVVSYWVGNTQYSMKMAEGYRDHAAKRYAVQLDLPWE